MNNQPRSIPATSRAGSPTSPRPRQEPWGPAASPPASPTAPASPPGLPTGWERGSPAQRAGGSLSCLGVNLSRVFMRTVPEMQGSSGSPRCCTPLWGLRRSPELVVVPGRGRSPPEGTGEGEGVGLCPQRGRGAARGWLPPPSPAAIRQQRPCRDPPTPLTPCLPPPPSPRALLLPGTNPKC